MLNIPEGGQGQKKIKMRSATSLESVCLQVLKSVASPDSFNMNQENSSIVESLRTHFVLLQQA